jgi:gastric triacylglycerol lipase
LLAPPSALAHCENELMKTMSPKYVRDLILKVADSIGLWSVLPYNYLQSGVAAEFCKLFDGQFCKLVLKFIMGNDPSIDDQDALEVGSSNVPAGAGYLTYMHYAQLINHKVPAFMRYDFENEAKNMKHYGQIFPPAYDLQAIDLPIALVGGDADQLANVQDVEWLNE